MFRTRLILALLTMAIAGYSARAQVPGFQGTLNNYDVGMNDEAKCRNPEPGKQRQCSQWFHFQFQAFEDGTVKAPIRITNDSLEGYCGRARIIVRDRANPPGNVLLDIQSARYCIAGKGADTGWHERTGVVPWTFKTDPAVGKYGADLYIVPVDYEGTGLDFFRIFRDAIQVIGPVAKIAEAIF